MSVLSPEQLKALAIELAAAPTPSGNGVPTSSGRPTTSGTRINAHDRSAYCDGLSRSAPELDGLRDALDGASVLARLLRKDRLIAENFALNELTEADLLNEGVPFSPVTSEHLQAALRTCLDAATDNVERMAKKASRTS